jgi:transposase
MRNSKIARHGRSKEKRSDCPLIVLALVVNVEGFIKYSAVYEGNMSDCKTLLDMINTLSASVGNRTEGSQKPIVVIDAGIASEENLKSIVDNNFDYICVSRTSLKNYTVKEGTSSVTVFDNRNRPIELIQVETCDATDSEYYLKVTSPTKTLKETSMYMQFFTRYEAGLSLIAKGITTKGGIKKYDRVNIRIGRLAQKYPSVNNLYNIHIEKNTDDICTSMTWEKKTQAVSDKENTYGVYFLRTSIAKPKEKLVWSVYNCIREIESTNRSLKTDLDLRPIYHKTDEASQAHLHLGLMAYWVVNTVRHQLKSQNITSDWRELVRIMNTQKCVTTTMKSDKGNLISVRCCSNPEPKAALIYQSLKMVYAPFIRKKYVVLKIDPDNNQISGKQANTS